MTDIAFTVELKAVFTVHSADLTDVDVHVGLVTQAQTATPQAHQAPKLQHPKDHQR